MPNIASRLRDWPARRLTLGKTAVALAFVAILVAGSAAAPDPLASLKAPPPSVPLSYRLDSARAARAAIVAKKGGELVATGADGTVYRLTIPADSLYLDERITMTPFAETSGLSGARVSAVELAPQGLHLFKPMRLSITPRSTPPGATTVAIEVAGPREKATAKAAFPLRSIHEIAIFHFSGAGVTSGGPASTLALLPPPSAPPTNIAGIPLPPPGSPGFLDGMRENVRSQVNRILQQVQNGTLSQARAREHVNGWIEIAKLIDAADKPRVLDLAKKGRMEDYQKLNDALQDRIQRSRQEEMLGLTDKPSLKEATEVLEAFAEALLKECREGRNPVRDRPSAQRLQVMARQLQMLGSTLDLEPCAWVLFVARGGGNGINYEVRLCKSVLTGDGPFGEWTIRITGAMVGQGSLMIEPGQMSGP